MSRGYRTQARRIPGSRWFFSKMRDTYAETPSAQDAAAAAIGLRGKCVQVAADIAAASVITGEISPAVHQP